MNHYPHSVRNQSLLYLETSLFGFYHDDSPHNYNRREAVKTLLHQIEMGILKAVTSPVTRDELAAAAEPLRSRLLSLLSEIDIQQADETAVRRLSNRYVSERVIPAGYIDDARHAAYATLLGADVLVTLNLQHLASEWAERKLNGVNMLEGYPAISIRTPEEVVFHED